MKRLGTVFRRAWDRFNEDGNAFLAQALAFSALFAVFPIISLAITVLGFVYGSDQGKARAVDLIHSLAPGVQGPLIDNLQNVIQQRTITGILAVVALIWSGKNLFLGVAYALNRALGIERGRPFFEDIAVAIVMLPVVGILLFVATLVPVAISFVAAYGGFGSSPTLPQVAGFTAGVLLIFVVTVVVYAFLPNRPADFRFSLPGAVFTTVAWEIAQIAFAIYSTHVNFAQVYGALAAFVILLLWFYYMGTIFLFGAQISAQWSAGFERS